MDLWPWRTDHLGSGTTSHVRSVRSSHGMHANESVSLSAQSGWVVGSDRKGQAQNEDLEEKSGGIEMTHFNGSDADAMPKCIEWGV